jgi:hypothetical protein
VPPAAAAMPGPAPEAPGASAASADATQDPGLV